MLLKSPYWEPFKDFHCKMAPHHIHVFRISVEDCFKGIEGDCSNLLPEVELHRSTKFLYANDQRKFLVRRYYVRRILSCFSTKSPEMLHFSRNGNGKPELNNIQFNVSQGKKYSIVVVHSNPIGVDIEYIDPSFAFEPILKTCFNVDEQHYVSKAEARIRFYSLWTRKEALLKATGEGLIDDLSSINSLHNQIFRNGQTFRITTLYCHEQHFLSIATTGEDKMFRFWDVTQ